MVKGIGQFLPNSLVSDILGIGISLFSGFAALATVLSPLETVEYNFDDYTGDSSGNDHMIAQSRANSAGSSSAPSTNFDGVSRPQHGGYDISAYESAPQN